MVMEDQVVKRFKEANQFSVDLFILGINNMVTLPKTTFAELFKAKSGVKTAAHRLQLEAFRKELAEAAIPVIHVPPSATLVKRTNNNDLISDIHHLAYSYVNEKASAEVIALYDGSKSSLEILNEVRQLLENAPGEAFNKLADVVARVVKENDTLKKDGKQSKESIKALEQKLVDANGTIEQLKIQFEKLGQVKCSHSRDTQNVEQCVRKKRNKPDDESDGSAPPAPLVTALQSTLVAVRESGISADQVQQQESHRPEDANSFRVKLANGKSMAETLADASTPATAVSKRPALKSLANGPNSTTRPVNNSSTARNNNNNNNNNKNNNRTSAPRRSKCLTGTGDALVGGRGLVAALKRHHFFVGKCDPRATAESITQYVQENVKCKVLLIEELSSTYTQKYHTNFRVTVEDIDSPKMLDPANWPRNIKIGRYFIPKLAKSHQNQPVCTSYQQTQGPAQSATCATQPTIPSGTQLNNLTSASNNNNSSEDDNMDQFNN
jgi:hypothetical protein